LKVVKRTLWDDLFFIASVCRSNRNHPCCSCTVFNFRGAAWPARACYA